MQQPLVLLDLLSLHVQFSFSHMQLLLKLLQPFVRFEHTFAHLLKYFYLLGHSLIQFLQLFELCMIGGVSRFVLGFGPAFLFSACGLLIRSVSLDLEHGLILSLLMSEHDFGLCLQCFIQSTRFGSCVVQTRLHSVLTLRLYRDKQLRRDRSLHLWLARVRIIGEFRHSVFAVLVTVWLLVTVVHQLRHCSVLPVS